MRVILYQTKTPLLKRGFSMVEILAVLVIMSIILVVSGAMIGKGVGMEGTKAARSEVRGALIRARSEAITSGNPIAAVMVGYEDGPETMRGRSIGIFEVRQDDAAGTYEVAKQKRRWVTLAKGIVFKKGPPVKDGALNAFAQQGGIEVEVTNSQSNSKEKVTASAIIFNSEGGVEYPSGSGELELQFGEGKIKNGKLIASRGRIEDSKLQEILLISRLTGRVRMLPQTK